MIRYKKGKQKMNVFDYVILGVLALFLLIGVLKGFVKTLISIAIWGGSIAIIYFFGDMLAGLIVNTVIGESIGGLFSGMFTGETANMIVVSGADGLIMENGMSIADALSGAGIPVFLHSLLIGMMVPGHALAEAVGLGMAKYVCIAIVSIGVLIILGIVGAIIWAVVKKGLKKAKLSGINRIIGGILYAGIGILVVSLVMMIIDMMSGLSFMEPVLRIRSEGVISNWFAENNLIRIVIEAVGKKSIG